MNINTLFSVASPLEQFETSSLVGVNAPIIGLNLTLTNLGLYVSLVLVVFLGLQMLAMNSNASSTGQSQGRVLLVPSR